MAVAADGSIALRVVVNHLATNQQIVTAQAPDRSQHAEHLQVEAHGTMQNYRAADAALRAGGERDPAFTKTQEYRNLAKQLAKLLLRQPVTAQ